MVRKHRTYYLTTFGCRVNQAESIEIEKNLQKTGWSPISKKQTPDLVIINSCVVTRKAEKEVKQLARSLRRKYPCTFLVIAGCGPTFWQLKGQDFKVADLLLEDQQKKKIGQILKKHLSFTCYHGMYGESSFLSRFTSVRALVKIQDGCDQFCAYCVVPFLRTKIWSKSITEVVSEVIDWQKKGVKEVILTGVNLGLHDPGLVDLLKKILARTKIERIRFGSINLEAISDELIDLYAREYQKNGPKTRLCRYFHIPVQSGSEKILKLMGRKYTSLQLIKVVRKIKTKIPDVTIGTDLIVGFPNETEKDFKHSLQLIKEIGFLKVHLFRFSPREGTLAWQMVKSGQWKTSDPKIVRQRAQKAQKLAQEIRRKEIESFRNDTLAVLFERETKPGLYQGYTDNFIQVQKRSSQNLVEKIRLVEI